MLVLGSNTAKQAVLTALLDPIEITGNYRSWLAIF
jgi:hypothetical protein